MLIRLICPFLSSPGRVNLWIQKTRKEHLNPFRWWPPLEWNVRPGLQPAAVLRIPRKALCCDLDARPNCLGWALLPSRSCCYQLTGNVSFHCLFQTVGWVPSAGFIHPRAGSFQQCRKVMCLQISIVGQSDLEAISFFHFIKLLLTGKL